MLQLIDWNNYFGMHCLTVPTYPKSSFKRDYGRRDDLPPPRSRAAVDYSSRAMPERRQSYRDDYSTRGPGYADPPRSTSRSTARRAYVDDSYGQRFERHPPPPPPPSYHREGRARDYDSISGSKRPYSALVSVTVDNVIYLVMYLHKCGLTFLQFFFWYFRMMFLLDMLMRASANQGHDWTMNMEVVLLNTGMAIVIGLLP